MMEEDTSGVVLPRSAMCEEMQAEESAGPVIGAVQPEPILIDEKPAPLFSKALQKKTKKEKEVEVAQLIDKSKKNALRLRELIVNLKLNSTPNDEACNDLYHMTSRRLQGLSTNWQWISLEFYLGASTLERTRDAEWRVVKKLLAGLGRRLPRMCPLNSATSTSSLVWLRPGSFVLSLVVRRREFTGSYLTPNATSARTFLLKQR